MPKERDVSDMFARAFLKHDMQDSVEKRGGYPLHDAYGNIVGHMVPGVGFVAAQTAMPMPSMPQSSMPRVASGGSIAKSKNGDFRTIGRREASDDEEDKLKEQLKHFVSTITDNELSMLTDLEKDRKLIDKSVVEKAHKKGKEIGVERPIDLGLVKWDTFDDVIELRLSPLGRKVLSILRT